MKQMFSPSWQQHFGLWAKTTCKQKQTREKSHKWDKNLEDVKEIPMLAMGGGARKWHPTLEGHQRGGCDPMKFATIAIAPTIKPPPQQNPKATNKPSFQ